MELEYFPTHVWLCPDCELGSRMWKSNVTCFRCNTFSEHHIRRRRTDGGTNMKSRYVFVCDGFEREFERPPPGEKMWGHIPSELRLKPNDVYTAESNIPNSGLGLFCRRDFLPVGSAMPYEGIFDNLELDDELYSSGLTGIHYTQRQTDYALSWPEYGPYGIIGNFRSNSFMYVTQSSLSSLSSLSSQTNFFKGMAPHRRTSLFISRPHI